MDDHHEELVWAAISAAAAVSVGLGRVALSAVGWVMEKRRKRDEQA